MERMEGVDAGYLYMETPSMHMHTLKIAVLGPFPAFDFDHFAAELGAHLDRLPPLRRRVVPVPYALHHPVWVADRRVDPKRHLVRHDLPDSAGRDELEALIGEIASAPLDRSLPLWQMHVVRLADGRVATVTKMHHALADGVAANALVGNILDSINSDDQVRTDPPLDPTPTRSRLIRFALRDGVTQSFSLPALLARTVRAVIALVRHQRRSEVSVPRALLDVPRVSFNGSLTPRRSFATASLSLERIKDVRRQHDVTVNDVVLGIVSGALRTWMADHGEQPSRSLVAGVPVSTEQPGAEPRLAGNRVSNLFTSLATDIDDPTERLRTISRTTAEAKIVQQTLGADMLTNWVQFTPPAPFSALMRAYSKRGVASRHAAPFNVIVSNVPGPRTPATISGAPLSDLYSVGPILEGIGLNVTVWSYGDRMNFSLLTCPDLLPDLRDVADRLPAALDELASA